MTYSRYEQETSIVWDEDEKAAHIYTASPITMRKLDGLCEQFPAHYHRIWYEDDAQGRVTAAKYIANSKFIRFAKPVQRTEAQIEAARERGKANAERLARYRKERS